MNLIANNDIALRLTCKLAWKDSQTPRLLFLGEVWALLDIGTRSLRSRVWAWCWNPKNSKQINFQGKELLTVSYVKLVSILRKELECKVENLKHMNLEVIKSNIKNILKLSVRE